MVTLNTLSSVAGPNGQNKTFTSVTTNIIIKVGNNPVGAIKSMSVKETRAIAMIDEVGTDGHIDSVPSKSTNISGSCSRTRFDNLRIAAAFSRGFIHAASQRLPFDIDIIDAFAGSDPSTFITTKIKNVWIANLSVDYRNDDFVIVESMEWEAETIYSILGANSNAIPAAAGGRNLQIPQPQNVFELSTDKGGRRGALDGFGLLQEISLI
jgi:hypothetical protein